MNKPHMHTIIFPLNIHFNRKLIYHISTTFHHILKLAPFKQNLWLSVTFERACTTLCLRRIGVIAISVTKFCRSTFKIITAKAERLPNMSNVPKKTVS